MDEKNEIRRAQAALDRLWALCNAASTFGGACWARATRLRIEAGEGCVAIINLEMSSCGASAELELAEGRTCPLYAGDGA